MKRIIPLLLCLALLTGCGVQAPEQPTTAPTSAPTAAATAAPTADPSIQRDTGMGFYFDTTVILTLYGADETAMDDVWAMCGRYEELLSKTIATSDVSRINAAGGEPVTVDPETWLILQRAKEISAMTEGAFSVTIAPISAMWDFTGGSKRMPGEAERLAALPLVDDQQIELRADHTVVLPQGMMIDLGGIAKGYIADKIAEMLTGRVYGAIISLGGNVYVIGDKPDGSQNIIGIRDPWGGPNDIMGRVFTKNTSVVTSGTYERFFEVDGTVYHHILDPKTGLPSTSDLVSASFVMDSSLTADALATACVVLGSQWSMAFANAQGLDAIFITKDGQTLLSEGFSAHHLYDPYIPLTNPK